MCNLVTSCAGQEQELDGLSSDLVLVTIYGGEQALHFVVVRKRSRLTSGSVDDSWDVTLALKGIPVDQYDGSISEVPTQHRLLRFFKKNVAPVTTVDCVGFDDIVAPYVTAEGPDLILKMDIEGAEWDILDYCDDKTLSRFAQIVGEFHNLFELRNKTFRDRAQRVFARLNNLFAVIHVHANNFGSVSRIAGKTMADTLEISYASRRRYRLEKSDEDFPTPLDGPNNPHTSDIRLGIFRF